MVEVLGVRSNRSFDTDALRRSFASLRPLPLVAGQLHRLRCSRAREHLGLSAELPSSTHRACGFVRGIPVGQL